MKTEYQRDVSTPMFTAAYLQKQDIEKNFNIHSWMNGNGLKNVNAYLHMCVSYMYVYIYTHIHIYIHTYILIHTHTYICIHIFQKYEYK